MIDHVQKHCLREPLSAVVYWYFTFTNTEKQKVSHFLCSLVADICSNRRDTPQALQDAYDQANFGQQKPTIKSIMAMLKEVATGFEHIYLFVDALDECPRSDAERSMLLDFLNEIRSWQMRCMHVLVTSRREVDIEESFSQVPPHLGSISSIRVQGTHLEHDIKKYIQRRLQHRLYQNWKPALKLVVEAKLASQADGM